MDKPVTIVIPVYGDWPSLTECIESLKECARSSDSIILANDCGPDWKAIEANILKAIDGHANFSYIKNPQNLGFIGNCNRAVLEVDHTKNDVLLLNSDTKVTEGFLEEMLEVLHADEKNGAVSPRSNNATLATVPLRSAAQKGIDQEASYELFRKIRDHLPASTVVPVAHGFCMLIKRKCIDEYGLFDEAFGKGYGEEVDFCLRIRQGGYKSLLANHAYVFHQEAKSFSLETKAKLLEVNNKIIWERYPSYRQMVREYMNEAVARENQIERLATKTRQSISSRLKNSLRQSSPRLYSTVQSIKAKLINK